MSDVEQPSLFDFFAGGEEEEKKEPVQEPVKPEPAKPEPVAEEKPVEDAAGGTPAPPEGERLLPGGLREVGEDGTGGEGPLHRMMDGHFLEYASYVIKDRAIPEIDDGLKPVQRRILHALHEMDDGRFIKVANVVGQTMAYHPHGDASIGDALVTLVNRGYVIEGQGNYGNLFTGDPAAAPRYIECRLTDLAATQLFGEELTEFVDSYDARHKEPVTLPAKIPLLLMLGADGIAVGLSTRILPHNFGELLAAQIAILQGKEPVIYPDFQQGGLVDVREYDHGKGRVRVRAVLEQKDESTLVVRELPYGVTTEGLIASVEDAAKKGKLKIKAIRDYTAENVEIEIALPGDADIAKATKALYAFTQCEASLTLRPVVIRDRRPVEMGVEEILRHNTRRLVELLRKELELERHKIDEALQKASLVRLFIIHRIYKQIEECTTAAAVKQEVRDGLAPFRDQLRRDITDDDIEMLLAIPIRRISLYDLNKSRKEEDDLLSDFAAVEKNLSNVTKYAIGYLKELYRDYAGDYPRRTKIVAFDAVETRELAAKNLEIRYDRAKGYVGYGDVEGEPLFKCSAYDKIVMVAEDSSFRMVAPPEKMFCEKKLVYLAVYDRDKVMTMVYVADGIARLKRFAFGGVIQNRDYACAPEEGAKVIYYSDASPETLYVKYAPKKGQQINQQAFETAKVAVRNPRTRGNQMTAKKIASIADQKPRNWDDKAGPKGALV
ncbi:MAG: DNA topoisomerase IV subunit A [Kiritimatiellae bacterium]|nr:DNA topoisomerase IV subunit A [Kiritimatiellia bacterium]